MTPSRTLGVFPWFVSRITRNRWYGKTPPLQQSATMNTQAPHTHVHAVPRPRVKRGHLAGPCSCLRTACFAGAASGRCRVESFVSTAPTPTHTCMHDATGYFAARCMPWRDHAQRFFATKRGGPEVYFRLPILDDPLPPALCLERSAGVSQATQRGRNMWAVMRRRRWYEVDISTVGCSSIVGRSGAGATLAIAGQRWNSRLECEAHGRDRYLTATQEDHGKLVVRSAHRAARHAAREHNEGASKTARSAARTLHCLGVPPRSTATQRSRRGDTCAPSQTPPSTHTDTTMRFGASGARHAPHAIQAIRDSL